MNGRPHATFRVRVIRDRFLCYTAGMKRYEAGCELVAWMGRTAPGEGGAVRMGFPGVAMGMRFRGVARWRWN